MTTTKILKYRHEKEVFMFTKVFSVVLATVGTLAATIGSQGCVIVFFDEPNQIIKYNNLLLR